jgi:Holliday junction resolvasome RuvABC endonuclease subunit
VVPGEERQVRVVGIDQSYTGFGFSVDGESKKRSFPASRYEHDIERLADIRRWLTGWFSLQNAGCPIDLVVMEGYANAAKFGREMAGELGGVVKLVIYDETGRYPLIIPPTSLKKFVTGKGNAKKNEMLLGVYRRWGVEFSDDNQADAFSLEKFGEVYLHLQEGEKSHDYTLALPKFQIEAVEAVRKAQ